MTRTILITGSSSGIGRATALHFQDQGWNVIATMRSPEKETELNQLDRVLVTRLDVQDAASIISAVEAGMKRFGRIDVLLNNAGYGAYGVLEATPISEVRRQFDVNVIGLMEVTQAVLSHFRANGAGTVINVSSMGGKVTFPLGSLYHGTKFAVEGITEALSWELAAIGVRAKLVEPGGIATDFGGRSFAFSNDESLVEYQPLVQRLLTGFAAFSEHLSTPEMVAEVIYEAATDDSDRMRYVAGEDARQIIDLRKAADDATYMAAIGQMMGITEG
ncbi:MAG: SDR family oxidoreductase [Bacteroidota bacterium]